MSLPPISTVPRRFNRMPTPQEREVLLSMIAKDESVLVLLQKQKDDQLSRIMESLATVARCQEVLDETRQCYNIASRYYSGINSSINGMGWSNLRIPEQVIDDISPHITALSQTLQGRDKVIEYLSNALPEARDGKLKVQEAVAQAEERLKVARAIADCDEGRLPQLEDMINRVKDQIDSNRFNLHAIFKIPSDVWELIFEEVVLLEHDINNYYTPIVIGKTHGRGALILSSVCFLWRSVMRSLPSLWKYIFIHLDETMEQSKSRIACHLTLSGSRPPVVTFYGNRGIWAVYNLTTLFQNRGFNKLEKLSCCFSRYNQNLASILCSNLPPPEELVLYQFEVLPPNISSFQVPVELFPTLRRITQVNNFIVWAIPIGINSGPMPACHLEEFTNINGSTTLFPSISGSTRPHHLRILRFDAPQFTIREPATYRSLEEIHAPLHVFLSQQQTSLGRCILPNLKVIVVIRTTESKDVRSLDAFTSPENMRGIEDITIHMSDMENNAYIVAWLSSFPKLTTLELCTSAVDSILDIIPKHDMDILKKNSLPLTKLIISSYPGSGDLILGLARFQRQAAAELKSGESFQGAILPNLQDIQFSTCPNVRNETKLQVERCLREPSYLEDTRGINDVD